MAAQKFLNIINGLITQIQAIATSAGSGDEGKIPALDANGRLDVTFMPADIGAENAVIAATEDLTAGDFVEIYISSGVKTRKADADGNKRAHGYVLAAVTSGQNATVYTDGKNTGVSGMTPGSPVWLSATAGGWTHTPPSGSGNLVQKLGVAVSATQINVDICEPVVLV